MIEFSSLSLASWLIVILAYPVLWITSGPLVVRSASYIKGEDGDSVDEIVGRAGKVVGKCENFLVLTFVFTGQFTALAVIFAAEGIISLEYDDEHYPTYFLSGTMVNFSYSIAIALLSIIVIRFGPNIISQMRTCF